MVHSVKVSDRNQIVLPEEELRAVGAKRGERLLVRAKGGIIELIPEKLAHTLLDRGLRDFKKMGLAGFEEGWDNEADEAWNDA